MPDINKLKAEITNKPLGDGYANYTTMTNVQVAARLKLLDRPLHKTTITGAQIYEVTDDAEYQALSAANKTEYGRIVGLSGDIICGVGSKARTKLAAIFGAGTNTRTALLALVDGANGQSREQELGLGDVHPGDVAAARAS